MLAKIITGFTSAGPVLIPGASCKFIALQNNGTGTWTLSVDGGGTSTGNGGTDPSATTGYILAPGATLFLTAAQYPTLGLRSIVGFFVGGGTQELRITTDDKDSTAPAHA
jgi:hypothetical protein